MEQNEKVSVIVPVFKVERYLRRCIESILKQTYDNLEIILVDDGSPDHCPWICDEYARQDSRITVFHTANGGVSAARNLAIEKSTGQYLAFVDGDDFVAPDYIEVLHRILDLTDADLSLCSWADVAEENPENIYLKEKKADLTDTSEICCYSSKEALRALFYQEPFDAAPWGKLFKRKLFDGIRFPLNCWYEDFAVMPQLFDKAELLAFYPYEGYGYVLRSAGATRGMFSDKKMQLLEIAEANERFVMERYPELEPAVFSRTVRANFHIYSQIPFLFRYRSYRKKIMDNIRKRRSIVLADPLARRGTKLALYLTYVGFWPIRIFHRMKSLGKQ